MLAWFHELSDPKVWIFLVVAVVFIVAWIAIEIRDRRDERLAEEADEQWAAQQVERNKLPTALSIPDVVHVKQPEPVAPVAGAVIRRATRPVPKRVKRPNRRKVARHK